MNQPLPSGLPRRLKKNAAISLHLSSLLKCFKRTSPILFVSWNYHLIVMRRKSLFSPEGRVVSNFNSSKVTFLEGNKWKSLKTLYILWSRNSFANNLVWGNSKGAISKIWGGWVHTIQTSSLLQDFSEPWICTFMQWIFGKGPQNKELLRFIWQSCLTIRMFLPQLFTIEKSEKKPGNCLSKVIRYSDYGMLYWHEKAWEIKHGKMTGQNLTYIL